MLKITMNKTEAEDRWTLHVQLPGTWVSELRTVWRNTQGADEHRRCLFDLNDVTFVDKVGENYWVHSPRKACNSKLAESTFAAY